MGICEQFSGLQMDKLIGGPLAAASASSIELANSTAEFINKVGFDKDGKVRTAAFMYQKRSMNDDGTINLDEMKVDVPMLAIVPIPNLQVDEVNILFDMEVKQSEKSDTSLDLGASVTGSLSLGIIKVSITGSVSSHSSNTRSSDNSAKYHVDVRAANHGIPEGLSRVLDMMAANISPSLVGSTPKDADGQSLSTTGKARAERIKTMRQEIMQLENRLNAAQKSLDDNILQLKKTGSAQQRIYQGNITSVLSTLEKDDEKIAIYGRAVDEMNMIWNGFQAQAGDTVKMMAATGTVPSPTTVSDLFALKSIDSSYKVASYGTNENYYKTLASAQKNAVDAQINVDKMEKELLEKRGEYNNVIAGTSKPSSTTDQPAKPVIPAK